MMTAIGFRQRMKGNLDMQTLANVEPGNAAGSGYVITDHAWRRMMSRGLSVRAVDAAIAFGRTIRTRGAEIYAIGRREVQRYGKNNVDLRAYEGVQVVCVPQNGTIMTVYRNRDFGSLRAGWHRPRRHGRRFLAA
jgi:hypothetical protein